MTQEYLKADHASGPRGVQGLVSNIKELQLFMVNAVTGDTDFGDLSFESVIVVVDPDIDYTNLYNESFLKIEALQGLGINIKNPNNFRTLSEWRLRCKNGDLPTYASRRRFVADLYEPMLRLLMDALTKQAAIGFSNQEFIRDLVRRFAPDGQGMTSALEVPNAISGSLARFRADHPIPSKTAFIIMRFSTTAFHTQITQAVKETLAAVGITGLRADDAEYHEDLLPNIQTYMHACAFGIAVLERIEKDDFNPNVSLEIGYMLGLGKPVCLLKDTTLPILQADLAGKLYRSFSLEDINGSIRRELSAWLVSKAFGSRSI